MHAFCFDRGEKKISLGMAKKGTVPHKIRNLPLHFSVIIFAIYMLLNYSYFLQLTSLYGFELFYEESYLQQAKIFFVSICCSCNPFP